MTQLQNRLATLDVMRGFAMLGILIMNVQSFSMPNAAYINPTAYGDFNGINQWLWIIGHMFADLKFMTLFSILFGAGILLFCEGAEQKTANIKTFHFKRMFGLLIFGLIHGYFFWYGDILFYYSVCGFIAYFFRNKSVRTLLILSVVFMSTATLYSLLFGFSIKYFPQEVLQELANSWKPSPALIEKDISAYRGSFLSALLYRANTTFMLQTYLFLTIYLWRVLAMMFIGMALYKSQFFHLKWKIENYKKLFLWSAVAGLMITFYGLKQLFANNFSFEYGMFLGNQFNFWGSVFLALSYAAGVVLFINAKYFLAIQKAFAAIGKTAFSNYFLQTLICTTIFYGYGLGFYGNFDRWQQMVLVITVWCIQSVVSSLWIKKYRFGPMEWLWRSCTYGQFPRMKN